MARMSARILDDRYRGLALRHSDPVIVPVMMKYKWRPWRSPISAWAVVQTKREAVFSSVELVWRPIAVFSEKSGAQAFLAELN